MVELTRQIDSSPWQHKAARRKIGQRHAIRVQMDGPVPPASPDIAGGLAAQHFRNYQAIEKWLNE